MSFVVPGITHCRKHWKRIDLINGCEDCEKEKMNMEETKKTIAIDMEEYKELLIIKGKYEELKSNSWLYNRTEKDYDLSKLTSEVGTVKLL